MSDAIRAFAIDVGFDKVGIVRAESLTPEAAALREWLSRGFHGEMKWLERDPQQRTDPRQIFPEATSVIVVALNYYTPHEHRVSTEGLMTGKISRYAWGDDYHDIVGDKLKRLLSLIKQRWPEANGKTCVDIQTTMAKAWAIRAGPGLLGNHPDLITRDSGSCIFLD